MGVRLKTNIYYDYEYSFKYILYVTLFMMPWNCILYLDYCINCSEVRANNIFSGEIQHKGFEHSSYTSSDVYVMYTKPRSSHR